MNDWISHSKKIVVKSISTTFRRTNTKARTPSATPSALLHDTCLCLATIPNSHSNQCKDKGGLHKNDTQDDVKVTPQIAVSRHTNEQHILRTHVHTQCSHTTSMQIHIHAWSMCTRTCIRTCTRTNTHTLFACVVVVSLLILIMWPHLRGWSRHPPLQPGHTKEIMWSPRMVYYPMPAPHTQLHPGGSKLKTIEIILDFIPIPVWSLLGWLASSAKLGEKVSSLCSD